MAVEQDGIDVSFPAAGTLTTGQYKLVVLEDDGQVALAAGSGTIGLGILQNKPSAENQPAVIRVAGISKIVGQDGLNERDLITSNANGFADATTTDGAAVWGQIVEATGGSAQVGGILLGHFRY